MIEFNIGTTEEYLESGGNPVVSTLVTVRPTRVSIVSNATTFNLTIQFMNYKGV